MRVSREQSPLRLSDMYVFIDTNERYISELECGKRAPSIPTLIRYSLLCNEPVENLLTQSYRKESQELLGRIPLLVKRLQEQPHRSLHENRIKYLTAIQRRLTPHL